MLSDAGSYIRQPIEIALGVQCGHATAACRGNRLPVDMIHDISRGKYGEDARMMQNRVYWVVGFWLVANIIALGILIWADLANDTTG